MPRASETTIWGAVEAGGTKFVCAIIDERFDTLRRLAIPTTTPSETLDAAAAFFAECASAFGAPAAFGIASFGPLIIDPKSKDYGVLQKTPKPGWSGARITDAVAAFGAPIFVDTDVNGACLGEWTAGAGRGCDTLAYVTVGTGIGAGVASRGAPLNGFSHYELGHIRPPQDLKRDPFAGCCPFHGNCLEGLASGPAIAHRWGDDLSSLSDNDAALDLEADYLAYLALTLILGHMPERIIFGGGVMKTPELISRVRVKTRVLVGGYLGDARFDKNLSDYLVRPLLGDSAGIIGAAALAKQGLARCRRAWGCGA